MEGGREGGREGILDITIEGICMSHTYIIMKICMHTLRSGV